MPNMIIKALDSTLKTVILEASKKQKSGYFSILISYKYHNDNMRDKCRSKVLLDTSITPISKFHILPINIIEASVENPTTSYGSEYC